MDEITKRIVLKLQSVSYQTDNENMLIQYSLGLLLEDTIKIFGIIMLGGFIGRLYDFLVTLLIFGSIRSNAGGIHAKTNFGCTVGMLLICISSTVIKEISISNAWLFELYILTFIMIIGFAPKTINRKYYPNYIIRRKKVLACILISIYFILAYQNVNIRTLIVCPIVIEVLTLLPNKKGRYYYEI